MSENLSTSPSTAGSTANLVLPPKPSKNTGNCCEVKCFVPIMKFIGWTVLIGILIFSLKAALDIKHDRKQQHSSIYCYECTTVSGSKLTKAGLPYEEKCLTSPRNYRKCNEGEICHVVRGESGKVKMTQRSCLNVKKIGCTTITKPTKATFCYCDKSYCLK